MLEDGADVPGSPGEALLNHQMHKYHDVCTPCLRIPIPANPGTRPT